METAWHRTTGRLRLYAHAVVLVRSRPGEAQQVQAFPAANMLFHAHLGGRVDSDTVPQAVLARTRHEPVSHELGGDLVGVFALLTATGTALLTHGAPRPTDDVCSPVDGMNRDLQHIAAQISPAADLVSAISPIGAWLEDRLCSRQPVDPHAMRAAQFLDCLAHEPQLAIEDHALGMRVGRRQLERDVRRYFGVSPKRFVHVARLQKALRLARASVPLAEAAIASGYCDQAHFSRQTKLLTGHTPLRLLAKPRSPLEAGFRNASANGLILA